jgi:DNA-binding CsgD family transcriptional regulator
METFGELLLPLYRAAQEISGDEFPDFAIGLLRSALPFTSTRWMTVIPQSDGVSISSVHLQNEPLDMVLDWQEISRQDPIYDAVMAKPGRGCNFHAPTLYAGPSLAIMRDYTTRYGHQNGLSVCQLTGSREHLTALSLFRCDPDDHFQKAEQLLQERFLPHLIEAASINRSLCFGRSGYALNEKGSVSTALSRMDGIFLYCAPRFKDLLNREWSSWTGLRLPGQLYTDLSKQGRFSGAVITVDSQRVGNLLILRARAVTGLDQLSPRELVVARLFGEGLSYKEIALKMSVSPNTVRSFLQRVYEKLKIRDKAELAALMRDAAE